MHAVLEHGQYINGPEVGELEAQLATRVGRGAVVGCGSGTDALVMALLALDVGPGDAVLVPAFTFAATAGAVSLLGATPVFVDVDDRSFSVTPERAAAAARWAIGRKLTVKAAFTVDLYGQPADSEGIGAALAQYGITVVADAAQSFGASRNGSPVGSLAPMTAISFFPSKPLGCYGDGGAIVSLDPGLDGLLRSIREHGKGAHRYEHVRLGMNGRLDSIQAAVLLQKLTIFDDELARRDAVAGRYADGLGDVVRCPVLDDGCTSAWAQYTIRVDHRDAVARALECDGVPTAVHYPVPLHLQRAFARFPVAGDGAPVAERLTREVLSVPMHPYLAEEAQNRIIAAVRKAVV